jgi:hypothetical protein
MIIAKLRAGAIDDSIEWMPCSLDPLLRSIIFAAGAINL